MNEYELRKLRRLVKNEIDRRNRINELLKSDLVQEYLKKTNTKITELDSNNIEEILSHILTNFSVKKTNGIYVCTHAYYIDYRINYEDTYYYTKDVSIDSKYAEHKHYYDIESGNSISAIIEPKKDDVRPLISEFERENIVLNPYNTCDNKNGYDEVRMDFFKTAVNEGQENAKKLVLTKYLRL